MKNSIKNGPDYIKICRNSIQIADNYLSVEPQLGLRLGLGFQPLRSEEKERC